MAERRHDLTIGEIIRFQRESRGLTQEKLGEMVGVTQQTIQAYEFGRRHPLLPIFQRIAKIMEWEEATAVKVWLAKKKDQVCAAEDVKFDKIMEKRCEICSST